MIAFVGRLTEGLSLLAGLSVLLMMVQVIADVVGKYVFHMPVPGTAEVVANYYMIACVFLSLAAIEARGSAIAVDLIYDQVGNKAKAFMMKAGQVATFFFYGGLGYFSWDVAMRAYRINESVDGLWRITVWPAKFMLPVGCAIACMILLIRIFGGDRVKLADGPATDIHAH